MRFFLAVLIGKADVLKIDRPLNILQFFGARLFLFDRLVHNGLYPLEAGHTVLELFKDVDQLFDRV